MTKKILVSWLGDSDIRNFSDHGGPLHSMLTDEGYGPFDELWLFMTPNGIPRGLEAGAREVARNQIGAFCADLGMELRIRQTEENFPVADMEKIYSFMTGELAALAKTNRGRGISLFYNLTAGTPAMHAIQLYLASRGDFSGTPLYTVPPAAPGEPNVFAAAFPFMLGREGGVPKGVPEPYTEPNQTIYDQARLKVADTDASVLICGETGTGKTMLARYIHDHDPLRRDREMVELNCAALGSDANSLISELFGHRKGAFTGADKARKGAFARADGSTLFLDEIGEIPLAHQGLLLRAIADSRFKPLGSEGEEESHPRIIAATNVDLPAAVRAGRFRADLYYRLAHYSPVLKPVREYTAEQRERLLDILLGKINARHHPHNPRSLSADARRILLNHPWHGNIREMEFRLRSICLLADDLVRGEDVAGQLFAMPAIEGGASPARPASFGPPSGTSPEEELPHDLTSWLKDWENYWMRSALAHHSAADAAARLGQKRSTFFSKKQKFGL